MLNTRFVLSEVTCSPIRLFSGHASVMQQGRSTGRCRAEISEQRVAIIGASRGLGFEFVKQMVGKKNNVHATVRHGGSDELLWLQKKNAGLSVGHLDVSDPASIKEWAQLLGEHSEALQFAIYVAGVVDDWADLEEIEEARMLHCFKVNTVGPLLTAQALVQQKLLGRGSVLAILTSKMGSLEDNTSGGSYAYRASKAAVNQVAKSLAKDLEGEGITVVLLHPGFVRTDMTRFSGLIDVDESVAGMISVLESSLPLGGRWYDYKKESIPW